MVINCTPSCYALRVVTYSKILGAIRPRPTAYSTVTVQHNHLNRKNVQQNEKIYKWKINIKLILKNSSTVKGANKQITERN